LRPKLLGSKKICGGTEKGPQTHDIKQKKHPGGRSRRPENQELKKEKSKLKSRERTQDVKESKNIFTGGKNKWAINKPIRPRVFAARTMPDKATHKEKKFRGSSSLALLGEPGATCPKDGTSPREMGKRKRRKEEGGEPCFFGGVKNKQARPKDVAPRTEPSKKSRGGEKRFET